ncbi:MAG: hypothetical protein AAF598_06370 [Bacteroidota bacterium]
MVQHSSARQEAFIYEALRTPRGSNLDNGGLHALKPVHLLTRLIDRLKENDRIALEELSAFSLGCTFPFDEQGGNMARTYALFSGLSENCTTTQFSGDPTTGLQALFYGVEKIQFGKAQTILCCGLESNSRIKETDKIGPIAFDPELALQLAYVPPGISADLLSSKFDLKRSALDGYTFNSVSLAKAAIEKGRFDHLMIPIRDQNGLSILEKDEYQDQKLDLDWLQDQQPAFQDIGNEGFDALALSKYPDLSRIRHRHTKASKAAYADGAAILVIGGEGQAKSKPLARILGIRLVGSEPTLGSLSMVHAAEAVLNDQTIKASDIQVWETDEKFAANALYFRKYFELDEHRHNAWGGDLAWGDTAAASGLMLICNALERLEADQEQFALVALSGLSGLGAACIIERLDP